MALVACRTSAQPASTSTPPTSATTPDAAAVLATSNVDAPLDAGVVVVAVDAGPPLALPFLDEKPEEVVLATEWMKEHGVPEAQVMPFVNTGGCAPHALGAPQESALVCDSVEHAEEGRGTPAAVYRVLGHRAVWVVRQKRPMQVLDVVVLITQLDREDPSWPNVLDLDLGFDAAGTTATLKEKQAGACAPRTTAPATDPTEARWNRFDDALKRRVCANRGTFVWKQGRFVRR